MSDLEKKARIFSNTEGNQSSKLMREVEYDTGRYVGYLAGFKDCEKEYEEKLRWIPVEERLPEIGMWIIIQLKNQPSKNKYVTMLPKNDFEINYIKENVISWRSFL